MVLFLITLMPLFYWFVQYLFNNDNVRFSDRILPFFYGFLAAIPVVLLQWALDVYFSLNWSPLGVYVFSFFNKDGFIIYPLIVLLFFAFRKKSYNGIPLRELTAWFCGYYFMFALSESIVMRGAMIPYDAILNPLLRLFQLLLFSVLLVRYLHETRPNFKLFYILTYFLLPWILNFLPTLNLLNYSFLFYILFLLTGAASLSLYLMESRGNIS